VLRVRNVNNNDCARITSELRMTKTRKFETKKTAAKKTKGVSKQKIHPSISLGVDGGQ
jgi:hypothetical protein